MPRKRTYKRVLHLITSAQKAEIETLAKRFSISENEVVRRALDFGLSILQKLGIDKSQDSDILITGQDSKEEKHDDQRD